MFQHLSRWNCLIIPKFDVVADMRPFCLLCSFRFIAYCV